MRVSLGLPTHRVDAVAEFVSATAIAEVARAAEDAGLDAVYVTDHPAPPADWLATGGHHTLDPFVALATAAAATSRIALQTNLLIPAYRHPLLTAKAVASLDALSGGRVRLGVGAGYLTGEFAALGIDFDGRNDALDAAIRTMQAAWRGEEVGGVLCRPLPARSGGPPVWVGGNSRRAMRRAVELGDGWVPMPSTPAAAAVLHTPGLSSTAELAQRVAALRELAAAAERDEALDVVFTPPSLSMFTRVLPDAGAVRAEFGALAEAGVTWLTVALPAVGRGELLRAVQWLGAEVLAA